jgi:hypothetical protein
MFKTIKRLLLEIPEHLSLAIKIILFLSIINAIYFKLWHVMSTNLFLLIILVFPQIIKKSYKIKIPREFEWILLLFVVFTFIIGTARTTLAPIFFGIATSMIAFLILLILYSSNQIKKNYFLIILFAFNFAVAFGFGLEFLKYWLKFMLGHELSSNIYSFSMQSMTYVIIGAAISSLLGYFYMSGRQGLIQPLVKKFLKINPSLKKSKENSLKEILEIVKEGENEKLEFKSTLRTNLYTNEIDKQMEHSCLKTISAFSNSNGGTLLIGISDEGKITGIEKDNFPNTDKFKLHLTNIIKEKIGKNNLHLINFETISSENKKIIKVNCKKSDKPIFLKSGQNEEFYIRTGPSSTQIIGSELINYIENRFKKKD